MHVHETGKLSYFTNYQRFGPSAEDCANTILAASPDLCFISCFAFSYALQTIELARNIKKRAPGLPIILGGAGPSAYPLYFIRDSAVDFVLTYEAEMSIKPFIDTVRAGTQDYGRVPNCYWKKDNHPQAPLAHLITGPKDISVAITKTHETGASVYFSSSLSRGCPKRCSFCSNFLVHGPSFRVADIDKVQQTLASLPRQFISAEKKSLIIFEDDNLLFNPAYCFKILHLFQKTFYPAAFLFENGIDYTLLSPELIDRLALEGLSKFNLSIVSLDRETARKENRILDTGHYEKVVGAIASHQMPCITYFICGFPSDTKESIAETLAFLHGQPTIIGISLFYAVPGIQGFKDVSLFDDLPPFLCNGSSAYPWNNSLSTETMITAFRLSRYCNLVKDDGKSQAENSAIRKIQETKRLFTLIKTPRGIEIVPVEHYDEELTEMFFSKVT
jgi:hypothetical protein